MNVKIVKFKNNTDTYGSLVPIEGEVDFPFPIKRIYYIYNVPKDIRRGFHSHKDLHQILINVSGSTDILVKTPNEEQIFHLSNPTEGLYIGPNIWREMYNFSEDSVLLVLASELYDENDYIRDYSKYVEYLNEIE